LRKPKRSSPSGMRVRQAGGRALWLDPATRITSKLPMRANFSSPDERHNLRDRASVPVAGRRSPWRLLTIPCNRRVSLDVDVTQPDLKSRSRHERKR
jgi:hypothetical protein